MRKTKYFFIASICLILFFFTSCRTTQYIEVPRIVHDSLYQKLMIHDSIIIRDSVSVLQAGDTIREVRWKYEYRDRVLRDTVNYTRVDTVGVPVTRIEYRTKEVEKPMIWYNKVFVFVGRLCCIAVLVYMIFLYIKKKIC